MERKLIAKIACDLSERPSELVTEHFFVESYVPPATDPEDYEWEDSSQ